MRQLLYFVIVTFLTFIYVGCTKEDYAIHRIDAPTNFVATRGDTSVFLKWDKVKNAAFYTLVRGLNVIADSLQVESYEDGLAPDTLTEYRIYAVDNMGWRSESYASDSGYLGIPDGIIPRAPVKFESSTNDLRGCLLSWSTGRFATSYKLYKAGKFYMNVSGNYFIDYAASTEPVEYTLYSENNNGTSVSGISAIGCKSYLCMDDYENYKEGDIVQPWTSLADRTMYYTEGSPQIVNGISHSGNQSMLISGGKVQLLHDWGGAKYEGYYVISFAARKEAGSFNVYSTFGINETYSDIGEWTKYSYKTGVVQVGESFNLTIESKGDDLPLYIDDFAIEYIAVN